MAFKFFRGGWRVSATIFVAVCTLVFILNLSVLLYTLRFRDNTVEDGTLVLRSGNTQSECSGVASLNRWAHLLINLLSTILLAGSNYCMQCLSAPTRRDIDRAHGHGRWLDIGIPSVKNLFRIDTGRLLLWLILGTSSLPLHLFFNSAVFTSTSSNNYAVFSVDNTFMGADSVSDSNYIDVSYILSSGSMTSQLNVDINWMAEKAGSLRTAAKQGNLVNLTAEECIQAYTKTFQSSYRSVLLVSEPDVDRDVENPEMSYIYSNVLNNNASNLVTYIHARFYSDFQCGGLQAFSWTCNMNGSFLRHADCDRACDEPAILQATKSNATWAPLGPDVHYCLAETTEATCKLQFSMGIAIAVVVLNFVKLTAMTLTVLYAFRKAPPLLTMGDAVASFLERPDQMTKAKCLLTRSKVSAAASGLKALDQGPKPYVRKRYHWSKGVSTVRWIVCLILYITALCAIGIYLSKGLAAMTGAKDVSTLWSMGFGSVNGRTLIQSDATEAGKTTLVPNVLVANTPQLILSILYFTYNGLFTYMLLCVEWDSYALQRKGLRISASRPLGAQRTGYFLQLPLRFSIPLIIFSLVFHWLVSQSIFVVNVTMLDYNGLPIVSGPSHVGHLLTCGYSPIAIIFSIILGGCLVITLIGFGRLKLKSGMPVAGSCSIAIAAACHSDGLKASESDMKIAQQPVQWGEIESWWLNQSPEDVKLLKPLPPKPGLPSHLSDLNTQYQPVPGSIAARLQAEAATSQNQRRLELRREESEEALLPASESNAGGETNGRTKEDPNISTSVDPAAVGHCTFSADDVVPPVQGKLYA